jgi:AraC family transcriptional regulator
MESGFLSRSLEKTAHLDEIDLTTHWNLRDRHIQSLMLALHADLEDGSPAGRCMGSLLVWHLASILFGAIRLEIEIIAPNSPAECLRLV